MSGAAVGIVGCWWQMRLLGDLRLRLPEFYRWFGAAFALYVGALWLVSRLERRTVPRRTVATTLALIGVAAIVARVLMLGTTPTLSDDIYRYRWDGLVQTSGIDPYRYAPDDSHVAFLRDAWWSLINFPHLRTVYPPLTQFAFRLGALLGNTLTMHKLVFVSAELLTIVCLLLLLRRRGRSPLWVAAYAWHPLVILEISGSGHNDALGIAMLWLGIAAWELRRYGAAGFSWALAFLSKYATILLVPWWWLRRVGRHQLGFFLALSVAPLLAHPTVLTAVAGSLGAMSSRFGSNGSVQLLLALLLGHSSVARLICAAGWLGFMWWWARREADVVRYLLGVMVVGAILSPVLHPWYLMWLIPALCFWRPWPVVTLTGTVVLSYMVWPAWQATGVWEIPRWAHVLEYVPVALLGLWEVWRSFDASRAAARSSLRIVVSE